MRMRTYLMMSACIFSIVSLFHLLRLVFHWPISVAGWAPPVWMSWFGFILPGWLASQGFRHARNAGRS
ncbi:MAG TPA: hypothetical protein VFV19_09125 [Candidatus Polarisedimenticolaceae bacterium]|nr:hypothetical protein [Candidatus Polarisedimenticolaceae bacterium]